MAHSVSRNLHEDLTGEQRSIKTPKQSRWWWITNTRKTATFCETKAIDRFYFIFCFIYLFILLFNILHTLTWICHGCSYVPHPEPPSHLSPYIISLDHPHAPAPSILYPVSNIDWRFVSYMIVYMFQCHSPKSSHPLPLPESPKVRSIHLCLFCCLAYRVITTIFLNSIYMC